MSGDLDIQHLDGRINEDMINTDDGEMCEERTSGPVAVQFDLCIMANGPRGIGE